MQTVVHGRLLISLGRLAIQIGTMLVEGEESLVNLR
jgi:hypothetical protein